MDGPTSNPAANPSATSQPPHPPLKVCQLLLDYLKLEGVSKIFGVPGGAAIFVMNELKRRQDEFDFVISRHETGAVYIAHGYSVIRGDLGVVLTTSGPSASNALTGAINSHTSCVPLLVLTGEIPQKYYGQGYLQEGVDARLDINVVFDNAVQFSEIIASPDHCATLFQQAFRQARSLPNRAVHISLPNNVAAETIADGTFGAPAPKSTDDYRAVPSGADAVKVRQVFDDLTKARRPLIFLGNGARAALRDFKRADAFKRFVNKFGIPVMTTPDAKGIFPDSEPMSLRNYGLCGCPWAEIYMGKLDFAFLMQFLGEALFKVFFGGPGPINAPVGPYDGLLVLGSSLGQLATTVVETNAYAKQLIPPNGPFIQVDLDQAVIGRAFPVNLGIVAEAGATIDELCRLGEAAPAPSTPDLGFRRTFIERIKKQYAACEHPEWLTSDAAPINPAAIMGVINEDFKRGHIFIDCGNCVGWSLNYLVVDPPVTCHSALAMGPMGFAVGAVIGGKLADPDEPCIAICGDGAFMMHGAEISTAAQNRIGAIWIVLDDNDLSMVSQGMAALFGSDSWRGYYKLGAPDLVKFSEGLGARAVAIDNREQFRAALRDAIERAQRDGQPQVIVAHIDKTVSPPYGWPHLG